MIVEDAGRLLALVVAMALFSPEAFAECRSGVKYEIYVGKQEYQPSECIALYAQFPLSFNSVKPASVRLEYKDADGSDVRTALQVDRVGSDNGLLTTRFCLSDALLRDASISIFWVNEHDRQVGTCKVSAHSGNLHDLLQSGGKKTIEPVVQ